MIPINVIAADGTTVLLKTLDGSVAEPLLQTLVAQPSLATNSFGTPVAMFAAKTTPGNLLAVHATSVNAGLRYLHIKNKATALAAGDVPDYAFPLPAGSATNPAAIEKTESFFGLGGKAFSLGITVGVSTTLGTFTSATATDHVVHVHYV